MWSLEDSHSQRQGVERGCPGLGREETGTSFQWAGGRVWDDKNMHMDGADGYTTLDILPATLTVH